MSEKRFALTPDPIIGDTGHESCALRQQNDALVDRGDRIHERSDGQLQIFRRLPGSHSASVERVERYDGGPGDDRGGLPGRICQGIRAGLPLRGLYSVSVVCNDPLYEPHPYDKDICGGTVDWHEDLVEKVKADWRAVYVAAPCWAKGAIQNAAYHLAWIGTSGLRFVVHPTIARTIADGPESGENFVPSAYR